MGTLPAEVLRDHHTTPCKVLEGYDHVICRQGWDRARATGQVSPARGDIRGRSRTIDHDRGQPLAAGKARMPPLPGLADPPPPRAPRLAPWATGCRPLRGLRILSFLC